MHRCSCKSKPKLVAKEGSVPTDKMEISKAHGTADLCISYLARHCILCWSCKGFMHAPLTTLQTERIWDRFKISSSSEIVTFQEVQISHRIAGASIIPWSISTLQKGQDKIQALMCTTIYTNP